MNIKHLVTFTLIAAAFTFAVGTLVGETDSFTALDVNGDGVISVEEAAGNPMLQEGWEKADANQDGQLERAEFSALEETEVIIIK